MQDKNGKIVSYAFIGLLLLVVVHSIVPETMPGRMVLDVLRIPIMVATIVLGVVTFYLNRDVLSDIEEELRKEEIAERKREAEFTLRYPMISRAWGVRWVARLMYKEGILLMLILIVFSIYGGFLIFHNLENPEFFHDEWFHVSTVKSLQEGRGFNLWNYVTDEPIFEYKRGRIFNWFVFQFSKIIGDNEYGLRFFPALIGTLLIPLIYFSFKNFIGKEASLLTSIIFSFSIIAIFLARFLRPYSLFLFSYLLFFYFFYYFIKKTHQENLLKNFITIFFIIFFFIVALDSSEFAKIILSFVGIFYFIYLFYYKETPITWKYYIMVLILLISIFILNYFNIINLSILPKQLSETISVTKIGDPTEIYYTYFFKMPFKNPFFSYAFFYLGVFLLLFNSLIRKKSNYLYFLIATLLPLIIMVYFFNRYEDFRYIYFLVPFIYGCIMLGFVWFFQNINNIFLKFNKNVILVLLIFILLITMIYPIVPGINIDGITLKGPSDWQDSDGKQYLHRRAVAPNLEEAYDYVENNISTPYALVVSNYKIKYIQQFKSEKIYYLSSKIKDNKLLTVSDMKGKNYKNIPNSTEISLQEVLENNNKVVFIIEYVHLIDEDIFNFLYNNTTNLANNTEIIEYEYNSFYENKTLYWPNIFIYEKTI
jgi:hypothetical protein